jgi:glycerophosphoryl diester phosphodiesterase
MPHIVAHRGGNELGFKPQSYQAYVNACKYATMLEGDLRWTKDGVIVIHHDANLNGTYKGEVNDYNWSTIRDKHTNADGSKVITLGSLLRIAQAYGKSVSLEFKINPTSTQIKKVKSELDKYGLRGRTRIFSFSSSVIDEIQAVGGMNVGLNSTTPVSIAAARASGNAVAIDIANLTSTWVNNYKAAGVRVQTYTLNTDAEDKKALTFWSKLDGVITDRPSRTKYWLGVMY